MTHTALTSEPWWDVDLQNVASISSVKVFNRTDCCTDRINNSYLLVSDTPFTSTGLAAGRAQAGVSSYPIASISGSLSIPVNRTGRYLRIQLAGSNFLSLAEVQVIGTAGQGAQAKVAAAGTQQGPAAVVDPAAGANGVAAPAGAAAADAAKVDAAKVDAAKADAAPAAAAEPAKAGADAATPADADQAATEPKVKAKADTDPADDTGAEK